MLVFWSIQTNFLHLSRFKFGATQRAVMHNCLFSNRAQPQLMQRVKRLACHCIGEISVSNIVFLTFNSSRTREPVLYLSTTIILCAHTKVLPGLVSLQRGREDDLRIVAAGCMVQPRCRARFCRFQQLYVHHHRELIPLVVLTLRQIVQVSPKHSDTALVSNMRSFLDEWKNIVFVLIT